jgi:hypothetical protein
MPMMRRGGFMPIGDRPCTRIVRKTVTLPDGTVLEDFPVEVAEPPDDNFAGNKVRPGHVDEHGMVPRRGSGT